MIDHLIRILKNAVGLPVLIAFVSVGILSADAQSNDSIFEVVPKESRTSLIEKLARFDECNRNEDFGCLFDLYLISESKESYIKRMRRDQKRKSRIAMIGFTPKRISRADEIETDAFMIQGCADYRTKNREYSSKEILIALQRDEKWYFTSFGETFDDGSCKPDAERLSMLHLHDQLGDSLRAR